MKDTLQIIDDVFGETICTHDQSAYISELRQMCFDRLSIGQAEYGDHWRKIDNVKEAYEELSDGINYLSFHMLKLLEADELTVNARTALVQAIISLANVYVSLRTNQENLTI